VTENQRRPVIAVAALLGTTILLFGHFFLISSTPYSICWSQPEIVGPKQKIAAATKYWINEEKISVPEGCCAVGRRFSGLGEMSGVSYNDFVSRGWTHFVVAPSNRTGPIEAALLVDNCGRVRNWTKELVD
jgi:hypothetical protein